MPRKRRIHYFEAIYHIMLRGNYRQNIFHTDKDRNYFLKLLARTTEKYGNKIHVYCLMDNHVHIVIEVARVPIWKIIQSLTSTYANYHNRINECEGHLFQGRYKAELVKDEQYLIELLYYIHQNPLKAKMVTNLNYYPWSSHPIYNGDKEQQWITTSYLESILKKYIVNNDNNYREFLRNKNKYISETQHFHIDDNGYLTITDNVMKKINSEIPINITTLTISKIAEIVCNDIDVDLELVTSSSLNQKACMARSLITYFCHYYAGHTIKEIAYFFSRQPDSISKTMHKQLKASHPIKLHIRSVENKLKKYVIE